MSQAHRKTLLNMHVHTRVATSSQCPSHQTLQPCWHTTYVMSTNGYPNPVHVDAILALYTPPSPRTTLISWTCTLPFIQQLARSKVAPAPRPIRAEEFCSATCEDYIIWKGLMICCHTYHNLQRAIMSPASCTGSRVAASSLRIEARCASP